MENITNYTEYIKKTNERYANDGNQSHLYKKSKSKVTKGMNVGNGVGYNDIEKQVDAMVIIGLCNPNNIHKSSDEIAEEMYSRLMDGELKNGTEDVASANKRFLDIKEGILERLYAD